MIDVGRPNYFSLDAYYATIDGLINSDEVERALWLINNPPAFYRENPPQKLLDIKKQLHKKTWTPVQYKGVYKNVVIDEQHTKNHWPTRASIVEQFVSQANAMGITPNISELAPGSDWLAMGLKHHGHKFTYERLSLDSDEHVFDKAIDSKFNIFIAAEIIEHLHNPFEIYQNYLKFNREADVVLITTPTYTYAGGMPDWENRELGHLRAYIPSEFHRICSEMFQGYTFKVQCDFIMHAIGEKA